MKKNLYKNPLQKELTVGRVMFTFRPSEKQLVCSIHTQHRLRMALGYRNTLQGRRPTPLHTPDGIDHTPKDHTHTWCHSLFNINKCSTDFLTHVYRCMHCKTQVNHKHAHKNTNILSIMQRQYKPIQTSLVIIYSPKKTKHNTHN